MAGLGHDPLLDNRDEALDPYDHLCVDKQLCSSTSNCEGKGSFSELCGELFHYSCLVKTAQFKLDIAAYMDQQPDCIHAGS